MCDSTKSKWKFKKGDVVIVTTTRFDELDYIQSGRVGIIASTGAGGWHQVNYTKEHSDWRTGNTYLDEDLDYHELVLTPLWKALS